MHARVIYYSQTGITRQLAKSIASDGKLEMSEIRCSRYEGGIGRLRAIGDSYFGHCPEIEVDPSIGAADVLILGGPVWRGGLAPPLRRFLMDAHRVPPIFGIFLTHGGPGNMYRLEKEIAEFPSLGPSIKFCIDRRDVVLPRTQISVQHFRAQLQPRLTWSPVQSSVSALFA